MEMVVWPFKMNSSWYRFDADKRILTVTLHVQPGAKRTEVSGLHGDALKIKLAAPPVEGKANEELRKFLAKTFVVPLKQVVLKQGERSRHKVVEIQSSVRPPEILLMAHAS